MAVLLGLGLILFAVGFGVRVTRGMSGRPLTARGAGSAIRQGAKRGSDAADAIWAKARSEDWLKRREARRTARAGRTPWTHHVASGTRRTAASYARRVTERANQPRRPGPMRRLLVPGSAAAVPLAAMGTVDDVPAPGTPGEFQRRRAERTASRMATGQPQAAAGNGGPRPAAVPARSLPPQPLTPVNGNGRTPPPMSSSTASAEKAIEGINEIHAAAVAGNILAKQAAIKAAEEVQLRLAAMLAMLSRTLAEPGYHYGPEITEPLSRAAVQDQAGAMNVSEADSALTTLMNMNLRELPGSGRQAPHHTELTESGAR